MCELLDSIHTFEEDFGTTWGAWEQGRVIDGRWPAKARRMVSFPLCWAGTDALGCGFKKRM